MYERYHIPTKTVQGRATPVAKFVITRADNCINCGKCERACIYGVHKRSEQDPRKMADPINYLCKNCFRCIADCPQRSLSMSPGAEYESLGGGIWTPLRMSTIWGESETGRIPVLGAGYRGMFVGPGYDSMWTDMSEIVRPTRDGIHGREFISTSADIGRKIDFLEFDADGHLAATPPRGVELPIPVVLDASRSHALYPNLLAAYASVAKTLGTLFLAPPAFFPADPKHELAGHLVPVYPEGTDIAETTLPTGARMAELQFRPNWKQDAKLFRSRFPETLLAIRVSGNEGVEMIVPDMVREGVDAVHVVFDEQGKEQANDGRHSKDALRAIHKTLVSKKIRDRITIIAGGGIAAAEHVPKTIICGADVVSLEKVLMIALECRDCSQSSKGKCPIGVQTLPSEWVEGRVQNLIGAWRDQLLEVLGAMGLREVRRLRGELGRAIFFEDVEKESFSDIAGGEQDG